MNKYIRLANHNTVKGWALWIIAALLSLLDALITLTTLGLIVTDFEHEFLFSDLVTWDDRTEDEMPP